MPRPASRTRRPAPLPASRPPLQRMMQLHAQLQASAFPNCRKMALALEVSSKTVQRDLDFMRDRLGLPLAYDPIKAGYYYTEPVAGFPTIEVTEGEVVALFVAQKALGLYQGTAYGRQLAHAFRKISDALREKITFTWAQMDDAISFRSIGTTVPDLEAFQEISRAVLRQREASFEYRKVRGPGWERRHIRPYHLGCVKNQWYAIGFDLARQELRTFALPRMRKVKMLATHFERPADFTIHDHLRQSFGIVTGDGRTHQVRLLFDPFAGRLVSERQWHASQKIKELPTGEVELTMQLGSLDEIKRWIGSWGAHVTVQGPRELIETVHRTATQVAARYAAKH